MPPIASSNKPNFFFTNNWPKEDITYHNFHNTFIQYAQAMNFDDNIETSIPIARPSNMCKAENTSVRNKTSNGQSSPQILGKP